ncbi:MAG: Asp-tRNA(Asn)/Glu-tRNA(Gln) amidotransferase subunit GatB [Myxococcales bacterium]
MEFVPVIGLEVHAQLSTASKIFCGCSTAFGAEPNHHTCPVCLGMPGTLPVLNERVLEYAIRTGLALGCEIRPHSVWSRKNYFYPDLPKGYQISQYDLPICEHGFLEIGTEAGEKRVRIARIHMEEDAGKNIHESGGNMSLVDYNRAGVPLLEIVTAPDLGSSEEASEYLRALRDIVVNLGVCSGNMEEGSFRCDANVSVMPKGSEKLGTRVELKNINSFRFVRQAIDYEIKRQIRVIEDGGTIVQETRLYDPGEGKTRSMRSKEEAHDYRYFPDPDLQPVKVEAERVARVRGELPELPRARMKRFVAQYGLTADDAKLLVFDADRRLGAYFEEVAAQYSDSRKLMNWFKGELFRALKEGEAQLHALKVTPAMFAALLTMVDKGEISGNAAKDVFGEMVRTGEPPEAIVERKGLKQVSDTSAIEVAVDTTLAAYPDEVTKYKGGKKQLLGFLTGQVMKSMKGKANPALVNELLKKKLDG